MIPRLLRVLGLLALAAGPGLVQATDKARIAMVGDMDAVSVGQDGYCGRRVDVQRTAWKGIFVTGDQRTWFRLKSTFHTPDFTYNCEGEYSFVPAAGRMYIVRFAFVEDQCRFELFRVVPGADPVAEPLTREPRRTCLAP